MIEKWPDEPPACLTDWCGAFFTQGDAGWVGLLGVAGGCWDDDITS